MFRDIALVNAPDTLMAHKHSLHSLLCAALLVPSFLALGYDSAPAVTERIKAIYADLPTNPDNVSVIESAAYAGNPAAGFYLGLAYQFGTGVPRDEEKALGYYKLVADRLRESAFNAARIYWLRAKYDDALPYLVMAADERASSGLVQAMVLLGQLYETGKTKLGKDYTAAARWYELAARQKDAYAIEKMGEFALYGYARAAQYREARIYLERAADMRNPDAQFLMGELFSRGMGLPVNRVEAGKWYLVAEAQFPAFKGKRAGFLSGLTEHEMSAAQKMAVIWNDVHGPQVVSDHLAIIDRLR